MSQENTPAMPITLQDLQTTLRVLQTIDQFQEAMQDTGGLRGGLYFSSDYKSSLKPAAETVQTFGEWFQVLTSRQDQASDVS